MTRVRLDEMERLAADRCLLGHRWQDALPERWLPGTAAAWGVRCLLPG